MRSQNWQNFRWENGGYICNFLNFEVQTRAPREKKVSWVEWCQWIRGHGRQSSWTELNELNWTERTEQRHLAPWSELNELAADAMKQVNWPERPRRQTSSWLAGICHWTVSRSVPMIVSEIMSHCWGNPDISLNLTFDDFGDLNIDLGENLTEILS